MLKQKSTINKDGETKYFITSELRSNIRLDFKKCFKYF